MQKSVNHNVYLKELETALATVKASLISNEETTLTAFKNAGITEKSSENLRKDKKKYLDKTSEYYSTVSTISDLSNEVKLVVNKATAMGTIAASDENTVTQNMANAAKSIETAMESIAILSSDAASINAKAASEDDSTKISRMAADANKKGVELAEKAEEATMSALRATILAAKSNANFISSLISDLSKSVDSLNGAITSTLQTAKTNMDNASKEYSTVLSTCATDEMVFEKATVDYNSAKEANSEDALKLGLEDALKVVREDKKTESTKK
jgi:hypothetical protein